MTAKDDELLTALADTDPARLDPPPATGSKRYESILEAAMKSASIPYLEDRTPARTNRSRRLARPVSRWAPLAAVAVIVLVAITFVVLRPGHESSASAAVLAAAEKTAGVQSLRATLSVEHANGSISTTHGEMSGSDAHIETESVTSDGTVYRESIVVIGDQIWEGRGSDTMSVSTLGPKGRLAGFADSCEAILTAALQAKEVRTEGSERIRGSEATHYRIVLDPASRAALAELSPSELAYFELEYPAHVETIDVWVADGLVHRIVVDGDLGTATVDFFDFNADISITPPTEG